MKSQRRKKQQRDKRARKEAGMKATGNSPYAQKVRARRWLSWDRATAAGAEDAKRGLS